MENNIITVSILGFHRTPLGLRLNTSPSIDVWVNSKEEYHTYKALVGSEAEFTPRMVTNRAGKQRKVYDLNVVDIADEELDKLFDRSFEPAEGETAEKPF